MLNLKFINILKFLKNICKFKNIKIDGKLKNKVNPIKNLLAWIRSIWYPQKEIKKIIGITENSKKI